MQAMMNSGGIAQTNCYVIADETAKQAVLFDAPDHTVSPLLDEIEKRRLDLIGLWLTHGHFDHIADHAVVRKRFPNAKLLIHELDVPKLRDPRPQTMLFDLPFTIPPVEPDGMLSDGQVLHIGSHRGSRSAHARPCARARDVPHSRRAGADRRGPDHHERRRPHRSAGF